MYKFTPASRNEAIVFGAARPGYTDNQVNEWLAFMQGQKIRRVCCLLPESQLAGYSNLLDVYRQAFGADRLCWTPIEDFHFVEVKIFTHEILPFLQSADRLQEKTVVHCSGGIGRTGHILAAWLVAARGMASGEAIESVKQTGRNPYEAVIAAPFKGRNPWKVAAEFKELLEECDRLRSRSSRSARSSTL
ncbi:protein-tyrosine phosphatase family protein [Leptolyngbya ohadii]|uniref:protein-tyrosine phosphatase family protein n=1 Tax=Leptolyngbya ohadii TaxID=1962290 RepID=UPI000B5A2181|nr:dual specificity protein phosphatase family protein [Leptolyngbya ohadii]